MSGKEKRVVLNLWRSQAEKLVKFLTTAKPKESFDMEFIEQTADRLQGTMDKQDNIQVPAPVTMSVSHVPPKQLKKMKKVIEKLGPIPKAKEPDLKEYYERIWEGFKKSDQMTKFKAGHGMTTCLQIFSRENKELKLDRITCKAYDQLTIYLVRKANEEETK